MKKVAEVASPRRGRPSKKNVSTQKSAPTGTAETSQVPQNGLKSINAQVTPKQTNTSSTQKKISSSKRNGNRSASTDSSGTISKRKRQTSPDKASSSVVKTSSPSNRASLREKVETLLSKTVKQEALKVVQKLKSQSSNAHNKLNLTQKLQMAQKRKVQPKNLFNRKLRKKQPKKSMNLHANETYKSEIKRLSTTDGFWSSKTSSRSSSPLGQPFDPPTQKNTNSGKKDSRTSTPDISPLLTKKQTVTKLQTDKEELTASKTNIPASELKRRRTKEGITVKDSVSSISNSRDASPSSASSLDKVIRQNARPSSRSSDNKLGLKPSNSDSNVLTDDSIQRKSKVKHKQVADGSGEKLQSHLDALETASVSSSTVCEDQSGSGSPASQFQKKKKILEYPAKDSLPEATVTKPSQLVGRMSKRKSIKSPKKTGQLTPQPSCSVSEESVVNPVVYKSSSSTRVKKTISLTNISGIRRIIKSPHKGTRNSLQRLKKKVKNCGSLEEQQLSGDLSDNDMDSKEADSESPIPESSSTIRTTSLPEFAISDLLESAELKRLNTTAGFWASTPDIGIVLSASNSRRLRDTDSNSIKDISGSKHVRGQSAHQPISSAKTKSTLLQHRKKRLHALKNSLRKIKQQISNDDLADQQQLLTIISQPATEFGSEQSPSIRAKKRGSKTRSILTTNNDLDQIREDISKNNVETSEETKLKTYDTEPYDTSVGETNTLVTDSPPANMLLVKTWKRGRNKLVQGSPSPISIKPSSIRTRGKGKEDCILKTLEVLEKLDPTIEYKQISGLANTPKVGKKAKVKDLKHNLFYEPSMGTDVSEINNEISFCGGPHVVNTEDKNNEADHISCSVIVNTEIVNENVKQNVALSVKGVEHRKDNLFESMDFNFPLSLNVPCVNSSSVDSGFVCPLKETIVEPQVIKSDHLLSESCCSEIKLEVSSPQLNNTVANKSVSINTFKNNDESDKLDVGDFKEFVDNKLTEDIPQQVDNTFVTPGHNTTLSDSSIVPKCQSPFAPLTTDSGEHKLATLHSKTDTVLNDGLFEKWDVLSSANASDLKLDRNTAISHKEKLFLEDHITSGNALSNITDMIGGIINCKNEIIVSYSPNAISVKEDSKKVMNVSIDKNQSSNQEGSSLSPTCKDVLEVTKDTEKEKPSLEVKTLLLFQHTKTGCLHDSTMGLSEQKKIENVSANEFDGLKSEGEMLTLIVKQVLTPDKKELVVETLTSSTGFNDGCVEPKETDIKSDEDQYAVKVKSIFNSPDIVDASTLSSVSASDCSGASTLPALQSADDDVSVQKANAGLSTMPFVQDSDNKLSTLSSVQPDWDKSPLYSVHLSDSNASPFNSSDQLLDKSSIIKQQNRRKNISTQASQTSEIVSQSLLDIQKSSYKSDSSPGALISTEELLNITNSPVKEHVKRKRRRNAWQRGVVRKVSNMSKKNSNQRWLLDSDKNSAQFLSETSLNDEAGDASLETSVVVVADSYDASLENSVVDDLGDASLETSVDDSGDVSLKVSVVDDLGGASIENSFDNAGDLSTETSGDNFLVASIVANINNEADDRLNGLQNDLQDKPNFPPAVKKSLSNMLKKLQTNANLANAVSVDNPYKGRYLRQVKPQEQDNNEISIGKKKLIANTEGNLERVSPQTLSSATGETSQQKQIPTNFGQPGEVKRKRGRPRKNREQSLPRLTALYNLPKLRPNSPWNKAPPDLSPQDIILHSSPSFDGEINKSTSDTDYVCESVDDTDLHLYLSGVSDEEQSPRKESSLISLNEMQSDIPFYQGNEYDNRKNESIHESAENNPAIETSAQSSVKETTKVVKPKIKGKRGRPPGIPMTEEERRRKMQKTFLSSDKYEELELVESLDSPHRRIHTVEVCSTPVFIDTPAAKFSLRKKSTRSPLEMLAMKQKQEEARYDLEQEKRQARLIHLREMRSARESGDGYLEDGEEDQFSDNMMVCSVVLSDFVKKLQLNDIEAPSYEDLTESTGQFSAHRISPECNEDGEDWCADIEEHGSEDRNDSRPFIPRLKLKRVIKRETSITNLKKLQDNEKIEPIKIVIKTEPLSDKTDQSGAKSNLSVDSNKPEGSNFKGSYMDFIRGSNFPDKLIPKQKLNIPIHTNLVSYKHNKTEPHSAEILTLPMPAVRNAFLTVENPLTAAHGITLADEYRMTNLSGSVGASTSHANTIAVVEKSLSAETNKRLSSGDEEDDDILILDLDDGAGDQNSEDTFRDILTQFSNCPSSLSSTQPSLNQMKSISGDISGMASRSNLVGQKNLVPGMQKNILRSYSNDEMGLMFEAYIGNNEESTGNHTDNLHNDAGISEGFRSHPEPNTTDSITCKSPTFVITDICSLKENTASDILVEDNCEATLDQEISENGGATNSLTVVAIDAESAANTTLPKEDSLTGQTVLDNTLQHGEADKETVSSLIDRVSAENGNQEETKTSNLESQANTPEKTNGDTCSDMTIIDNNNVTQALKPVPRVSAPVKKPSFANDNSRSPKHSTYYSSGEEEWRVKIILQPDKFQSGKYSCKRCSFTTSSKLVIESHIYSHIPGVQFRCAYCESEFSSMAATASHLKNTHSLSEAKIHISRHIDERNFYDKEVAVFSEENSQHSTVQAAGGTSNEGQSPPVIISVVVSGGVGSTRAGRPTAPPRRFVCTHCGFSTNVKEDADHHVLDLHSLQSLFACLLCSENVCYTESEIKKHCATVHPARNHPYRKLPDFYDAEQLNLKEKALSQDDCENIFDRVSSIFQDDSQTAGAPIDHRKKAKEYLYLQEGWREKTRVEADSTTAVDYTEEQSAPQTPIQESTIDDGCHQADVAENEASDTTETITQTTTINVVTGNTDLNKTARIRDDSFITSSAGSVAKDSSLIPLAIQSSADTEHQDHETIKTTQEILRQPEEPPACNSNLESAVDDHNVNEDISHPCIENNDDDGDGMGLKIIQVVSLSGQEEDNVDEQAPTDQQHPNQIDNGVTLNNENYQSELRPSESIAPTLSKALASQQSLSSSVKATVQKDTLSHEKVYVPSTASSAAPNADASTVPSAPVASPSFAGVLPLSYKCNACKVHTPYLLMMVKHLKARHPNMRCFSCPYCKTTHSFVSQKQLRHHVKQSHPNKFGRNEIALSEDAKKFVEAMVLPIGPECIRVGSRIVLEEDIHTCTYCQVKMTSLANVYEHLNTQHSDLFEFVCPVCQSFKSKLLTEISEHSLRTHKSSLDTDKVHVSVPKNLFTALKCISKNGKYIEKNLVGIAGSGSIDKMSGRSPSAVPELSQKIQSATAKGGASLKAGVASMDNVAAHSQLTVATFAQAPSAHVGIPLLSPPQSNQPIFAIPVMSANIGTIPTTRSVVAFSSSLFDTSSLATTPHMAIASQPNPSIQNAAASSFLSPLPQPAHMKSTNTQLNKQSPLSQLHHRPNERRHGSTKSLPVLNIPTIKPRASSIAIKSQPSSKMSDDHTATDKVPANTLSVFKSSQASKPTNQPSHKPGSTSSSCIDNLPDDEPNPDAFKIFNLRPNASPSSSPAIPSGVPTVYPPVSSSVTAGYLQGPIAGFPPGMVIPQNFLPMPFPYHQHQPLMQEMLAQKHNQRTSPLTRHPRMQHPPSATMSTPQQQQPAVRHSFQQDLTSSNVFLKKQQQQRELYHLKNQHQLLRQNQQQAIPRAHPAHQQPPSLSGQVYQPQPLPISPHTFDQRLPMGSGDFSQSSMFMSPILASSSSPIPSSSSSAQHTNSQSSSPSKPSKGVHKRSSSLYQCPYCPVLVTLKALEVASHIQQHHTGKQVAFRRIA